jgi:L-fuculose-phosphate aldolase
MYAGWNLKDIIKDFPEVYRYTSVGPNVPKLQATSTELADQTYEKFLDGGDKVMYDIVGQECHGVTAVAANPWDAFEHIERLEHICQIVLASKK